MVVQQPSDALNTGLLATHDANVKLVLSTEPFKSALAKPPLAIENGGSVEPFSKSSFTAIMTRDGAYTCGMNVLHLDLRYIPIPGVPIRGSAVERAQTSKFGKPSVLSPCPAICLGADEDPSTMLGALKNQQPEETTIAYVGAIARDIKANANRDTLYGWLSCIMLCPMEFRHTTSEDEKRNIAIKCRDQIASDCVATARTSMQRAWQVVRTWLSLSDDDPTVPATVQCYSDLELTETSFTDPITATFVEGSMYIYKHAWKPSARILHLCNAVDNELDFRSP